MDNQTEKTYPTQGVRILQGPADNGGIPAAVRSSSSHGPSADLPTGSAPEAASVVNNLEEGAPPATQPGAGFLTSEAIETSAVDKADASCSIQEDAVIPIPNELIHGSKETHVMD